MVGEIKEVHVAGVAIVGDGADADLGLVHVVVGETSGVKHRLGDALSFWLSQTRGVAIQSGGVVGLDHVWAWILELRA